MKQSRFSDEHIIGKVSAYDVLQVAFKVWWHGSAGSQEAKILEEENGKLKHLLADAMLDVPTLKKMLGKNF